MNATQILKWRIGKGLGRQWSAGFVVMLSQVVGVRREWNRRWTQRNADGGDEENEVFLGMRGLRGV